MWDIYIAPALVPFASPCCLRFWFLVQSLKYNNGARFSFLPGVSFVTGPVTNQRARALSNLEAAMIERKHIDHADLLELGKMLLLLIKRQQTTMDYSSLTELDKRVTGENLARAS
jgi:hypothetical protein